MGKGAAMWGWLVNRSVRGGKSGNSNTASSNVERLGGVWGMGL